MKQDLHKKRTLRNRGKLKRFNVDRYRITVSKSLKNISVQIIDDKENKTIVSASSNEKNEFHILPINKKDKNVSVMWGTYRSLINNAILGVTKGHEKNLELNGVGFKVSQQGDELKLKLGFSHDATYKVPKGINIKIEKQTKINISGTDKALVSKTASEIKSLKPVEPYKGKGIKEKDQYVIRKEGNKK